jgi:hypothetical protein
MPRPRNDTPRAYGRQANGKTIKSLSLDEEVTQAVQAAADARGISFSEMVNGILKGTIKLTGKEKKMRKSGKVEG